VGAGLALDGHHRLGDLLDHRLLLVVAEDVLDHLDIDQRHDVPPVGVTFRVDAVGIPTAASVVPCSGRFPPVQEVKLGGTGSEAGVRRFLLRCGPGVDGR